MPPNPRPESPGTTSDPPAPGRTSRLLKIVAGLTAVLSLALAARQVTVFITDYRARQTRVRELLATSALQSRAGDHPAAWTALSQALRTDPGNAAVRSAREDAAMAWLENARTGSTSPTFTALADTLSPALTEGLLHSDSTRKADLLAHLGWADFLRWREGRSDLSPPTRYREALALDPHNPFAHAMLGHWLLWQSDSVGQAAGHFRDALAAGRAREYIRHMQLSALGNRRSAGTAVELIRVANEMRSSGDSVPENARGELWTALSGSFISPAADPPPALVLAAVPPADLLATYRWLFDGSGYPAAKGASYSYQLAALQEAAGDTAAALAGYRALIADKQGVPDGLRPRVTQAVARLSGKH